MLPATEIAARQTALTARWHALTPAVAPASGSGQADAFFRLVNENHLRDVSLRPEQDIARGDDLGFVAVYRAQRAIDRLNPQRYRLPSQA